MDAQFHKSRKVSRETMKKLVQRSNHPAMLRFVALQVLLVGAAIWVVYSWQMPWWHFLLAEFVIGVLLCSCFAAMHETVHNTAFKSRELNGLAAFILGLEQIYPSTLFRELHFTHHRHTHIPGKDPEITFMGKPAPAVVTSLPFYLGWLSGLPLMLYKTFMVIVGALGSPEPLRKVMLPFLRPKYRVQFMLESWIVLGVQVTFLLLALFVNPGFWGLLIAQAVGHSLLASYLAPEHNGLPHEGDIMEKTRSIQTPGFVKILMWNMPYHAEHHAYPGVPFHHLPALSRELQDEIIHNKDNHPRFHLSVFSGKYAGKKQPQ